jgi:hypothetical protein
MAYQTRDVLDAMQRDAGLRLAQVKVDGGASVNDALLQFQADILGVAVRRPVVAETTALGAAYLAGLAVGYWKDTADVARNWALDREFAPSIPSAAANRHAGWQGRWSAPGLGEFDFCARRRSFWHAPTRAAGGARRAAATEPPAEALPFIEDDYGRAVAEAKKSKLPIFVDAWALW